MRSMIAIAAAALFLSATAGFAHAAPPRGDEDYTIDLSVIPGGPTLYLKCSRGDTLTDCGLVSIWQQSNGVPGLQTVTKMYGGAPKPQDTPLLA